jgi:RNA polymerase sigma-70 factor (ECF subfamily)
MASDSLSDNDLERLLRVGNEDALAQLFARHRNRLWKIVDFRMPASLRKRVDADDILQDAFTAAQDRLEHYARNPLSSGFLWLRLIALQTLTDVCRAHGGPQRDARRDVALDTGPSDATSLSLIHGLAASATSPSGAAMRREMLEQIENAISQLEPMDQEVLALRHFEELGNGEVARVLGIEEKAASIRYIRALRRLKDALSDLAGFEGLKGG